MPLDAPTPQREIVQYRDDQLSVPDTCLDFFERNKLLLGSLHRHEREQDEVWTTDNQHLLRRMLCEVSTELTLNSKVAELFEPGRDNSCEVICAKDSSRFSVPTLSKRANTQIQLAIGAPKIINGYHRADEAVGWFRESLELRPDSEATLAQLKQALQGAENRSFIT